MGFKKVKHSEDPQKEAQPKVDINAIPDFDEEPPAVLNSDRSVSMKEALAHDAKANHCYGLLVNEPKTDAHHFAHQVCAEIKIVLAGLSPKQIWWTEARANFLNRRPCGLETVNDTYTLSWEVDIEDVDARLMLQDVREHLQWVFGPSFVIRPVGGLGPSAKDWNFQYKG